MSLIPAPEGISVSWLDMRNISAVSGLANTFSENYALEVFSRRDLSEDNLDRCRADLICFEYDYPEISTLHFLQKIHEIFPDSPVLMFTEQHSEALAVWAFRTGVWDYYVTPMDEIAIAEVIRSVQNASCFRCASRQQKNCSAIARLPNEVRFRAPPEGHQVLQPAMNHIGANYSEKITEEVLAFLCNLTPSAFSRLFKRTLGITFQDYLAQYRLRESTRLLLNPAANISDVAYSVGYRDPSYYARAFKKHLGVSPSQFRQLVKDEAEVGLITDKLLKSA